MNRCLHPSESHVLPGKIGNGPFCREPGCGFLLAGARLSQWRIASLVKHDQYMDLYVALPIVGQAQSHKQTLIRVFRRTSGIFFPRIKLLQTLYHPHIHPILWAEEGERGGQICIVSGWEEQGSLAQFLHKNPSLSAPAIARIVWQIGEALHLAHKQRIVHGHLKAENFLLAAPGTLQVCDFYYSFLGAEISGPPGPLRAPEQLLGKTELASDQYALAAFAHQLLKNSSLATQQYPAHLIERMRSGPLTHSFLPIFSFSHPLDQILSHALHENPADRFPDVRTFVHTFCSVLERSTRPATKQTAVSFPSRPGFPSGILDNARALPSTTTSPLPMPGQQTQEGIRQEKLPHGATQTCMLPGHTAFITALQWGPDGRYLVSGSEDGDIRLWAFQSRIGRPYKSLQGHTGKVSALSWSVQGVLAAASNDSSIRIWDIASSVNRASSSIQAEASWWAHDNEVTTLSWSPDGSILASGGKDGTLRLWDRKEQLLNKRQAHSGKGVRALAWSPNQQFIATAGTDHQIHIWSPFLERRLASWEAHPDEIRHLEWCPQSRFLASTAGKKERSIRLWNPQTGQHVLTLEEHIGEIAGLFWSPDGCWLASASTDGTLRFWRTDTLQQQGRVSPIFPAVTIEPAPQLMIGTPARNLLAIATRALSIAIFDVNSK